MNQIGQRNPLGWCLSPRQRTEARPTKTQYVIQLSGYIWAAERLGRLEGLRVLDVACGEGMGIAPLTQLGARAWAVDLDSSALCRARSRCAQPNVKFIAMDAARLALAPGRFDFVISQDTLEHVDEDERFVSEIYRILKPGGAAVIFTPASPVHVIRPRPEHLREYSVESLLALLTKYFREVELFGRRPNSTLARMESSMNDVRRFDRFGVRRWMIPVAVRHFLGTWLLRKRGLPGLSATDPGLIEYFEGTEGTGTLIAWCRKELS